MIPQSVNDALVTLQAQKDVADTASLAKVTSAAALVQAQSDDFQAATTLAQAATDLNTKRMQLEAILDSFYTVGGSI